MATTLKLKKTGAAAPRGPRAEPRAPVRGAGAGPKKARPTLAQAQAERAEREAQYQAARPRAKPRPGAEPGPASGSNRGPKAGPKSGPRTGPHSGPKPAPRDAGARADRPGSKPPPRPPARPRQDPFQRAASGSTAAPTRFDTRHAPPLREREQAAHAEPAEHAQHAEHAPGTLRLSKRMSELGLASRREADEWIAKGWVRVDGRVVAELGARVLPDQLITIDARAKGQQEQRVTVLLNKPVGYVSGQAEDGYEPALVLVTPDNQWRADTSGRRFSREHLRSLVPAGRLDIDSVGLLVLTQDGRIAKTLIGEASDVEKEYLVRVEPMNGVPLDEPGLALLRHGLELDGEALRPAQVEWVNDDQLRFVLKQGKKRQIRRMCEAVGLKVVGLKRVRIGRVMLGDLPAGQWRYLRADESFA